MTPILDDALKRLDSALGLLEASVSRRLEAERRRGDLETELQLMQDDRARLAEELDGALTRLQRFEAATDDVGQRVQLAIGAIQSVLAQAGRLEPEDSLSMSQVSVTDRRQDLPHRLRRGRGAASEGPGGSLDAKIEEMRAAFGEIGDMRLHVMAAITMADETARDSGSASRRMEAELNGTCILRLHGR